MVLSFAASLAVTYIFNLGKKADEDLTWMLSYGYNLLAVGVFVLGVFLLSRFVMLENKRLKYCSVIVRKYPFNHHSVGSLCTVYQ